MKQVDKQLLLKDLSARLLYGVKVSLQYEGKQLTGVLDAVYPTEERVIVDKLSKAIAPIDVRCGGFKLDESNIMPYLRPMSDMTEEEFKILEEIDKMRLLYSSRHLTLRFDGEVVDFLNEKMLDWGGLIPRGLAIAVTKENNPYEKR